MIERKKDRESLSARERLFAAGTESIASLGLEGVNTNTVARQAGVGVGTFYAHFKDKSALHREIVSTGLAFLQAALASAQRDSSSLPLPEQVRASVRAFVETASSRPLLFRIALAAPPAARRGNIELSPRALAKRLGELQRRGSLDSALDVDIAARVFLAGQRQVVLAWLEAGQQPSAEALIETLTRQHPALIRPL
jgi:AcrR family transcriptional regulator